MRQPLVSIIIPVFNEEKYLSFCLDSLKNQTYKNFEIIVVDDGSTDSSPEIVKNFQFSVKNLRFFRQIHQGPGMARNLGASKAKGKILVFVDADMKFDKDYIKYLVKPIIEGRAIGTFHEKEEIANYSNIWSLCWNINSDFDFKSRFPKKLPKKIGIFRAILKKKFEEVGGFNPQKGYKDDETIYEKLKIESVKALESICYHFNPDSLFDVFLSAKWIGKSGFYPKNFKNLLRFSVFNSIRISLKKIFLKKAPIGFFIFKIVYDLGMFLGIFFGKKGGAK